MRKWLGGWISTYWRSLSVVFIVLLLNYFIVTRVVGLAYSSFSWSAFAQAYDPYDDDDDDDDDPAEPYGELTPAPSQEPVVTSPHGKFAHIYPLGHGQTVSHANPGGNCAG